MRRKKLLRQVAAAAVALSMAVSLSAPAFAATFDLSNGGLVIKADESGITVTQDGKTGSTSIKDDEEIVITGTYNSTGGATQTAEENQQDENQPVTPAKAPAKEETSEETQEAEDAPAAEEKQEQKDTEVPADPEQNTETENKDNNSDPADEEKKEQNAPAKGELNASAGEGQESKAEDEGQPKPEAKASAEATASTSDDASNGPRKASAYEDRMGEDSHDYGYNSGLRAGIVQIINNTAKKIKVSLSNAHIDLPTAADTSARGQAAIDVQGGDVELKFSGSNTLTGSGGSAGIQKNDKTQDGKENTGTLTITADSQSDTLDVKVDKNALGQDNQGAAIGGGGRKTDGKYGGCGTKNIVIEGNGTVNTNAQIGSGYRGGAATGIVIRGNAVVNVENYGIGGYGLPSWATEKPGETDVTITGNANVTVQNGTIGSGVRRGEVCGNAKINISGNAEVNVEGGDNAAAIGSGAGGDADVTITGNAKVTAVQKSDWYGGGAGIGGGANGKGHVTIGGKAQVKATGSAEKHDGGGAYGAGAAIGDGGTTGKKGTDPVQNGENQFSTDKDSIQDGAKVEMTNIGRNGPNTVTQTRQDNQWVTNGDTEQTPEKCKHSKGEYAAEKVSPTCTEKGSQTYRCSSCGEITRVVELAPDSGFWSHDRQTVTVQPTCTEDGYKVTKCGRCGKELDSHYSIVKALGHQFVETTVAPTCTESGYTVKKCTRCDEEEGERTNLVAPLGHEYKNGVCIRCGAPEPQENGSAAPNYTVTGAETYETSVVDGRYIIAVPSEDAALNAVLGDLRAIKAQGADVVVFRTRSRESSLVIDEMLSMGTDVTPFVLVHNGGEARLTINGAAHNELIH